MGWSAESVESVAWPTRSSAARCRLRRLSQKSTSHQIRGDLEHLHAGATVYLLPQHLIVMSGCGGKIGSVVICICRRTATARLNGSLGGLVCPKAQRSRRSVGCSTCRSIVRSALGLSFDGRSSTLSIHFRRNGGAGGTGMYDGQSYGFQGGSRGAGHASASEFGDERAPSRSVNGANGSNWSLEMFGGASPPPSEPV